MRIPLEISIDLTAQELLAPPPIETTVEVEDVCAMDPLLQAGTVANNALRAVEADEEAIELTAEDIDELLAKAFKS